MPYLKSTFRSSGAREIVLFSIYRHVAPPELYCPIGVNEFRRIGMMYITIVEMNNIAPEERNVCSKCQIEVLIALEERNVFLSYDMIIGKTMGSIVRDHV